MRAGRMDRKITFQRKVEARDGYGAITFTWQDVARDVWAEKVEQRGREYLAAKQHTPEMQRIYRVRYRSDVDTTMRVLADGQGWDIQHVAELGRRRGLEITCKVPGENHG